MQTLFIPVMLIGTIDFCCDLDLGLGSQGQCTQPNLVSFSRTPQKISMKFDMVLMQIKLKMLIKILSGI